MRTARLSRLEPVILKYLGRLREIDNKILERAVDSRANPMFHHLGTNASHLHANHFGLMARHGALDTRQADLVAHQSLQISILTIRRPQI